MVMDTGKPIAGLARDLGIAILDCPVLGTKQPAEEGKLIVLASGDKALRQRAQPVFDAISHRTIWVGEAGAGSQRAIADHFRDSRGRCRARSGSSAAQLNGKGPIAEGAISSSRTRQRSWFPSSALGTPSQ